VSLGRLEGGLDRVRAVIGDEESTTDSSSAVGDRETTGPVSPPRISELDSAVEEFDAEGLATLLTDVSDVSEDAADDSNTVSESVHALETSPLEEAFGTLETEVDEETGVAPIPPSADPDDPCFEWLEPCDLEPISEA